jgi:hypothetical protein
MCQKRKGSIAGFNNANDDKRYETTQQLRKLEMITTHTVVINIFYNFKKS